jgi:hypothetical protein
MEQSYSNTILAIIQYESPADQTFLTINSKMIYGYFEDEETGTNVMISIITPEQKAILLSKGYIVQTVEKNPQMQNYVFYENTVANQGRYLQSLGEVYVITPHQILVRKNIQQTNEATISSNFKELPLKDIRPKLAEKNNVRATEQIISVTPLPTKSLQQMQNNGYYYGIIIVISFILIGIVAFIAWKKFNKTPPQTINEPPTPHIN